MAIFTAAGALTGLGTLLATAVPAISGIAGGVLSAKEKGDARKQEKEMETIHTTEPGFNDFGEELADENKFGLIGPRVDFSNIKKRKPFGMMRT